MPKVSVIVPVYKAEKYVGKCIKSILAQTFTDFELILVDDGSPDKSGAICEEYAKTDTRIRVIHKENSGVSAARNVGIDSSIGEWATFVDSDDWIEKDYLSEMVSVTKSDTDMVFCSLENINNVKICSTEILPASDIVSYLWRKHYLEMTGPVSKLFSGEIIRKKNIKFPIGIHMGEDAVFLFEYISACSGNIILLPLNLYNVFKSEESLSTKYYSFQEEYYCFKVWKKSYERMINSQNNIKDRELNMWNNRLGDTFIRVFLTMIYNSTQNQLCEYRSMYGRIDSDDLNSFIEFYKPVTIKRRVLKFLISHKCYIGMYLLSKVIK